MKKLVYSGEEVNQILFEVTLEKVKAEEKLEKIEQIVNEEIQIMESDLLWKIKEVLGVEDKGVKL